MNQLIATLVLYIFTYHILSVQSCTAGTSGCWRCLNSTSCIACSGGYRMLDNLTCESCSVPGCRQCEYHRDICQNAYSGYTVVDNVVQACTVQYCSVCDTGISTCRVCKSNYRLVNSTYCQPCAQNFCRKCTGDPLICDMCSPSYYLSSNNTCQTNNVGNCSVGLTADQCQICNTGYSLTNASTCTRCTDPICGDCRNDVGICISCYDMFGVQSTTNQCVRCIEPKCITCKLNALICTGCVYQQFYGLNSTGGCSSCTVSFCQICHRNVNKCQRCTATHGVDDNFDCSPCADPLCLHCPNNYSTCYRCMDLHGFANNTCQPCTDLNCLDCWSSVNFCYSCAQRYALQAQTCIPCSDPQCITCYPYYSCSQCQLGYGLGLFDGRCHICISSPFNCLDCNTSNLFNCLSCHDGFYLNPALSICQPCPEYCQLCHVINATGQVQCTTCFDNTTTTIYLINNLTCLRILCGDFIVDLLEECDNERNRPYDGCNDVCLLEDNFTCFDSNSTGSICSYTGILQMQFIDLIRKHDEDHIPLNQFVLKISIFPPLHVISNSTQQQLKALFKFNAQGFNFLRITFNSITGQLQFSGQIIQNIPQHSKIQIKFNPTISAQLQYSLTPENILIINSNKKFYHISSSDITLSNIVLYVCYALVALFWLAFLLGVLLKRLAGLEAMFVLQVAYMSFFLLPSNMLITFEQTHPLRFSAGYNHAFTAEQSVDLPSEHAPYFSQFHFSERLLANNFNFCMLLQLISLVMIPIATVRLRSFFKNFRGEQQYRKQQQQQSISEAVRQLNRLVYYHELSYQLLMSSCMLNLMPFVLCLTLFFRHGQVLHIPSLVIISTQLIILVATLIKFVCDPSPFDYFRFSFGIAELKMRHYCLVVLVLVSTVALMIMLDNLPYACLVPAVLMLVYTLAYRPYKQLSENLRSGWNWLAVSSLLFYRVFVGMLCEEQDLNKTVANVYFMVNVLVVLPLTVGMAIVFVVYYYWYYNYKCHEQSKQNEKNRQMQVQYYRRKLLGQLVRINPNIEMDVIKHQTTFRQLINPNQSLLIAAKKCYEIKNSNKNRSIQKNLYQMQDLQEFRKEIIESNVSFNKNVNRICQVKMQRTQKRQLNEEENKQELKKYRQKLKNEMKGGYRDNQKQLINNQYKYKYKQFNIDFDEEQQTHQRDYKTGQAVSKSVDQSGGHMMNGNNQQQIENKRKKECRQLKKQIAKSIISDEQRYINLQAAINRTQQDMKQVIQSEIIEEYDKINTNIENYHQ